MEQFTLNHAHLSPFLERLLPRQEVLSYKVFLLKHPHSRHGMHPQNKGISVWGVAPLHVSTPETANSSSLHLDDSAAFKLRGNKMFILFIFQLISFTLKLPE